MCWISYVKVYFIYIKYNLYNTRKYKKQRPLLFLLCTLNINFMGILLSLLVQWERSEEEWDWLDSWSHLMSR